MLLDGGGNTSLINNSANATWTGTGTLSVSHSHFVNNGTLLISGAPIFNADHGDFTNNGTLRKDVSAGQFVVNLLGSTFINTGLVDVQSGTLFLVDQSGGNMGSTGAGNTFNVGAGASINFGAPAFGALPLGFNGTTFSGPGAKMLGPVLGFFDMAGTINATNLGLSGTIRPNGMTLVGTLNWLYGTIDAGTQLTIAPGSTLNVNGVNYPLVDHFVSLCCGAQSFQNFGTINVNSPVTYISFTSGAGLWNRAGGQFNVNNNLYLGTGLPEFRNDGTVTLGFPIEFAISNGLVPLTFTNTGTFNLNGSKFSVFGAGNAYVQTAGVTNLGAPARTMSFSAFDSFTASGGLVKGQGAIGDNFTFNVNGTATLAPGNSPGRIQVSGAYNQGGGTLAIELNGTNPGVTHDQLTVSGPMTLAGPLAVTMGFAPPVGTSFVIIDNIGPGPVSGTFTGLPQNATLTVGGVKLQVSYAGGSGNDVTLKVVSASAGPTSTTVGVSPNPSAIGQLVTFTANVNGASPTGTVQFRDGAGNLGAPVTLVSGKATFTTASLAVGGHPITAIYSGDAANLASTSPVVTQTVVASESPIPALGTWNLATLALALAVLAGARARRRRGTPRR